MQQKTSDTWDAEELTPTPPSGNQSYLSAISPAMRAIERVVTDIAPTDIPVLLIGESGTGKEIVALQVHRLSGRRRETFVKVPCSAATPDAFLAVNGNGKRNFHPGTLFLDEVCELNATCQTRLLHALPDGEAILSEGARQPLTARVICATNRSLEEEMKAGRFREELYFRINGVCLRLPPLRHRREDILPLVHHFLRRYAEVFRRPVPALSAQGLQTLMECSWPGNVRQLENVARNIVALGDEGKPIADLDVAFNGVHAGTPSNGGTSLKKAARTASRQAERELILKTLARTRWNRKRAAQELQISYKALLYKLKQIGFDESATS